MATWAWDVPGYVQGHRFSQGKQYWDAATGRFKDQAGYDHLGNFADVVVGTPAFSVHGTRSREGLLLDNACHLKFLPSIPWEGTMLVVFKPTLVTAAVTQWHWLWSTSPTETNNGNIILSRASGVNSLQYRTPSSQLASGSTPVGALVSGNIAIGAFSTSQQTRTMFSTKDGVTVTETAPSVVSVHGNAQAMASATPSVPIGGVNGTHVRLGDIIGDGTVTPNATDYMHLFEQHFWKGNVLTGASLPQVASFIASLKSYYGLA